MQEAHNKSKASQPEYAVSITASAEMMNPIVLGHFKQMEILAFRPEKKKLKGVINRSLQVSYIVRIIQGTEPGNTAVIQLSASPEGLSPLD